MINDENFQPGNNFSRNQKQFQIINNLKHHFHNDNFSSSRNLLRNKFKLMATET